ncbi:MAG: GNAT family N-acetyltransferase [Fimbriimonadaceae bacterium]|nr:GNAT family N-acetyltransferase [Fimbriimonadaceae bacterium]
MSFKPALRDEIIAPTMNLWNLEYPQMPRVEDEVRANFLHVVEGSFERHWLTDRALITVYDQGRVEPEHLEADIFVHPEFDDPVWGHAVDHLIAEMRSTPAKDLAIWTNSLRPLRQRALEERGFKVSQTVPVSRLNLNDFDVTPFQNRLDGFHDRGLKVTTIQELHDAGVDWPPLLYDATTQMIQDMPNPVPPSIMGLDQYREMVKNPAIYKYDLMFAAMDGDRIAGYSRVTPSAAADDLVLTGLSGTVREYRRQGVVTALKVSGILALRERGYRILQTDNDETNPMYHLNLELGFKKAWDWVRYALTLRV